MASSLILEDGTGLADASTYETAANVRAYALARGVTLAPDTNDGDAVVDQMITKGMDYIEAMRDQFQGWRVRPDVQALQFPRDGIMVEDQGYDFVLRNGYENIVAGFAYRNPAIIPKELKTALSALALQVKKGVDLQPTSVSGQFVTFKKIGPIERHFSEAVGVYTLPQMPLVTATLASLLKRGGPLLSYRA